MESEAKLVRHCEYLTKENMKQSPNIGSVKRNMFLCFVFKSAKAEGDCQINSLLYPNLMNKLTEANVKSALESSESLVN